MLKYRATSTRQNGGHEVAYFTHDEKRATDWADAEFKAGFDAIVFEVEEREIYRRKHPAPPLPTKCSRGHKLKKGRKDCHVCGEVVCA